MTRTIQLIALLLLVLPSGIFAQEIKKDTTELTIGQGTMLIVKDSATKEIVYKKNLMTKAEKKKKRNVQVDIFALDLGVNLPMVDNSINLPQELEGFETNTWKSTHVGMHFIPMKFNLIRNHVNLLTSIDLDVTKFYFQNNLRLVPRQDEMTFIDDSIDYSKNRLTSTYLQIPLLLNFQTAPHRSSRNFRLSVGGYAGVLLGANTKVKSEQFGKTKIRDDFNLERVRYGLTARVGFSFVELYANYNLTSLFRKDQGPDMTVVSAGVKLIQF